MDTITPEPIVTPSQVETPVETTAPVTPTEATPEVKAPEVPAVPAAEAKPEFTSEQDTRDHLKKVLQWNEKEAAKPVEEKKPEVKTEPVVEKTEEQKAAELKAAEEKAAAEKTEVKTEASPYDKSGPLPAEKLAAALAEDKALEAALTGKTIKLDDGREINLKDAMFESSRMAAQAAPMLEMFPTIEAAQEAEQGARTYFDLEETFVAQADPVKGRDNYNTFMSKMIELSYVRDAEGKPIPNPAIPGTFKTDGSVEAHFRHTVDVEFDQIGKIAALMAEKGNEAHKEYAEELKAWVDFGNDLRNNGYKMPGTSGDKPVIPPEVQAELDRSRTRDKELTEREAAQQKQQHETFEEKVSDATLEQVTPLLQSTLDQTSLSKYEKEKVAEDVWKDITEALGKNALFKRGIDQMMSRRELSDAVRQRRVAHNVSYMKAVIGGILDKRLQEAGATRFKANQQRQEQIATQIDRSKMEPRSGATTPTPQTATLEGDALHQKAVEQARAKNGGKDPSNSEVLNETLALKRILQSA